MKKTTHTIITITGTVGGPIWMPSAICAKPFKYRSDDGSFACNRHSDNSKPTLRDIVLEVTNDGDFQSAEVADATVTIERRTDGQTGSVTRRRSWDIRQFPSVADCVVGEGSDRYWEIVNCFSEVEIGEED